jgi:hypothetical protein
LVGIFALSAGLEWFGIGPLGTALSQTVLSVLEVTLGVYISFEVLIMGLRPSSRRRIDRPEDVVEFYEQRDCADQFVEMSISSEWDTESHPDTIPAVVEAVPEKPTPVSMLTASIDTDAYYPLPDRVQRLYEPVIDTLKEEFVDEGHFNQMKLRPDGYEAESFNFGTTTFFNNYATNLNPDTDVYHSRTPRELLHSELFTSDGQLRPLSGNEATELPYIAASAGVLVAENGEAVFPIRSRDIVIEGLNIGLSFGGSWDLDTVSRTSIATQISDELSEERTELSDDTTISLTYLGTLRRLELLGKPDCFVVAIADEVPDWEVASREETEILVERVVPEGVTVDSVETLIEHADSVTRRIQQLVRQNPYLPAAGLYYWLYLLNYHAEQTTAS